MKKSNFGIFLSFMLLFFLSSCGEKKETLRSKLILNEVLIENESNFQDDYGIHSAWIEIFNKSYTSADLAGYYIKVSNQPGDTLEYFIPKGDVLTLIKPRQHSLFWADGQPNRGTFHTNFTLKTDVTNWIGLYDAGKNLVDQVSIPANLLKANQSYARVNDANMKWEVKGANSEKYVTPSTNNQTLNSNIKRDKFELHDASGVGMAFTAMSVVFSGLLLLYISFRIVGILSVEAGKYRLKRLKTIHHEKFEKTESEISGEVVAAISMALHEMQDDVHDVEETVLTINRVKRTYSPWSAKIYNLRQIPNKK